MSKVQPGEQSARLAAGAQARLDREAAGKRALQDFANGARLALKEEGYTRDALKAAMKDVAAESVREYFRTHGMQTVMRTIVREELERQLGATLNGGAAMPALIKNVIAEEARKYAAEFIKNNMTVTMKDHW